MNEICGQRVSAASSRAYLVGASCLPIGISGLLIVGSLANLIASPGAAIWTVGGLLLASVPFVVLWRGLARPASSPARADRLVTVGSILLGISVVELLWIGLAGAGIG